MVVDRIKHTKPASQRTFLDELEPIPYEITEEEIASMPPRMKKILFGIEPGKPQPPEPRTAEPEVHGEARIEPAEPKPEPEIFDPAAAAEFPPAGEHTITLIFAPAEGDDRAEALARSVEHREIEGDGGRRLASRFAAATADKLKKLNEILAGREDVIVLVDGKRPPFARSLWLPLMYIFTAGREE